MPVESLSHYFQIQSQEKRIPVAKDIEKGRPAVVVNIKGERFSFFIGPNS